MVNQRLIRKITRFFIEKILVNHGKSTIGAIEITATSNKK